MLLKMSRNSRVCFAALAVFVVATSLVATTDAATYIVGGTTGWTIPPNAAVYETFASQNTFGVGDVLVFNFPTGQHDVAPVTKEAYDGCNASAAIQLLTVGPASITLTSAGTHHFICTFGQHCVAGQKLAVTVTGPSSSPLPSPTPLAPITPPPTAPPTSSSAPPPQLTPGVSSPSSPPVSEGPSPSDSASPPSEGPTPFGPTSPPSEGPSPDGSAPGPSEGPGPSGPETPAPGSGPAPDADGSPPPPSSASKTGVATIFAGMFISAAIGYLF